MASPTDSEGQIELLKGTLDMLILQTLAAEPLHGHAIVRKLYDSSRAAVLLDHGSLYPALHRLERKGWIGGKWGTSENNRKARFYSLTPKGRKQLESETKEWQRLVSTVALILNPAK